MGGILKIIGGIVVVGLGITYFDYTKLPERIAEECEGRGGNYPYCQCVGAIAARQLSFVQFTQQTIEQGGISYIRERSAFSGSLYAQCDTLR